MLLTHSKGLGLRSFPPVLFNFGIDESGWSQHSTPRAADPPSPPSTAHFCTQGEFRAVHPHIYRAPWYKGMPVGPCRFFTRSHLPDQSGSPRWWELGKHGGEEFERLTIGAQALREKCSSFWASYLEEFQWFTVWGNEKRRQDRQLASSDSWVAL